MTIESPGAPVRIWQPALQSLRGFAAIWVVLYHTEVARAEVGVPPLGVPGFRFGWLGVDLFFVLSGFLLAPLFFHRPPATGGFWLDRFLRIGPAYYAALLFALAYLALLGHPLPSLADIGWNLAFLSNLDAQTNLAINAVFWSLAVEMQFYLILPLVGRVFATKWWPLALGACLATSFWWRAATWQWAEAGAGLHAHSIWFFQGLFGLPSFLGHFALGAAAARIQRVPFPTAAWWFGLLLAALPSVLLIPEGSLAFGFDTYTGHVLVRPLAAMGFALIVLACATAGPVQDLLSRNMFRHLGAISYSLYLIHPHILLGLARIVPPAPHPWWYLVAATAVSLLAAQLLWQFVEYPADRWRRRRKARADARLPA